ncbi:MAG TPA: 3' terminal RNA ribose 2'-O-methyltransferase Hen1 [Symbiobacteriaceae bacterium]|nr:3' terminal RNA ribose 2'-O-methyltransferase Hen1 [Symbiobacteriaceae bacterium]
MLLTLSTSHRPATDLGYLLHKNPARAQSFDLTFGKAHVFYPEATDERCTCALVIDVDPVGLVRGKGSASGPLEQYVNDRPYTASAFLSVALAEVFGTALSGRSKDRPEVAASPIPLEATVAVLPCKGGEDLLRRLFEPLGYEVHAEAHPLDPDSPEWGPSRYLTVRLKAVTRLADLLKHLYVLIPVLDNAKHYFVGDDEVAKLLRHGEGWLGEHPERDLITKRYLKYRSSLAREALSRLIPDEPETDDEAPEPERKVSLHRQRLEAALAELKACGARRVMDLGCGEGKLLRLLLEEPAFEQILGMDVSARSLEIARDRLRLDRNAHAARRVELIQGSITYRDKRLSGYDAAAVVEVIEHLDPPRLSAFERVLFEFARPATIVLTTPNREYNALYEGLAEDALRHGDHRFEWTRAEFATWAQATAQRFGYSLKLAPVGPQDPEKGAPSQMGVFTLRTEALPDDTADS